MGAGKVWRAKFFAENPHLRVAAQREQEARTGPAEHRPQRKFNGGDLMNICAECGRSWPCADNGVM
jgi:hypothetical protein